MTDVMFDTALRRRRRQYRGLVAHASRHPASQIHPRRLVARTAAWGEPPVNGRCRWCGDKTDAMRKRWHGYCLDAYLVASGQHPAEMQLTLCEICGDKATDLDHRLAIVVARALGRKALLRAFLPANLRQLCRDCHRRKTKQDRMLAKLILTCSTDWAGAREVVRTQRAWLQVFLLPCSLAGLRDSEGGG